MIFTEIMGWIATILTGLIGLPVVINTFLAKKPPKVSHLSWWIYYLGIFSFALYGLSLPDLKMIITQILSGLTTVTFLLQIYFFSLKKGENFHKNFIFIALGLVMYGGILLTGILFGISAFGENQLKPAAKYLGIISGLCVNIAFLPQTIQGIRGKTLIFIPIFFIIILFSLNFSWVIYMSLKLPEVPDFLIGLIFQVIGLSIATVQMSAYFWQIRQAKAKNKEVKINWF